MSVEAEMAVLRRLGFFSCLPDKQLRTLVFGAERLRLPEGRILYNQGDIADSAYIVLGGRVGLFRAIGGEAGAAAARQNIYAAPAGAMLGAFALIFDKRRETGAYMAQKGDILRISRAAFRRLLHRDAETRRCLFDYIFANFKFMTLRLEKRAQALSAAA